MPSWVLIARLIVALVIGTAGFMKLRRTESTIAAAVGLGLDRRLSRVVGKLLAPAEIGLAVLMLPGVTAFASTAAAGLMLAAFAVLIGVNLARGNRPACACFGAAADQPISVLTLARNLLLVALAAIALTPGPGMEGTISGITAGIDSVGTSASLAALLVLIVLEGTAIVVLAARSLRREQDAPVEAHSDAAPRKAGWPIGTRAPDFSLETLDGLRVSLSDLLRRQKPILMVFTDPSCGPCQAILPEVGDWQADFDEVLTVAVVTTGSVEENRAEALSHGLRDVFVQGADEVGRGYLYEGTPGAVLVGRDGLLRSRVASGVGAVRSLAAAATLEASPPQSIPGRPAQRGPLQIPQGELAPPVELVTVEGDTFTLSEFTGHIVVLLFWEPTCEYCRQLLPRILELVTHETRFQLVTVSSGGRAANELQGLPGPVLLEDDGATHRAFGSSGTPSAVLIDALGRVSSPLAVGADDVVALLKRADVLSKAAASPRLSEHP